MTVPPKNTDKTHFGFEEISVSEKTGRVADVFHSVASRYDLMNDLMSLGVHRLWKRYAIQLGQFHRGHRVLDLAGGTGDLSALISPQVGEEGTVTLADINSSMLTAGRDRLLNEGIGNNISFAQVNAEALSFQSNTFDRVIIGFGLRNVTHQDRALASIFRVLKPGGQLLILEFSRPLSAGVKALYDIYSFKILPTLGKWFAQDEASYQYLVESIRMHPDQKTLKSKMEMMGFERCDVFNLMGGIVAIHRGYKF